MKVKAGDKLWMYISPTFERVTVTAISVLGIYIDDTYIFNTLDFGFYLRYGFGKKKVFFLKHKWLLPLAIIVDPFILIWINRFFYKYQIEKKIKQWMKRLCR